MEFHSEEIIFSAEDRWANLKSNDIENYHLTSFDVGVSTVYPKEFFVDEEQKIRACFRADKKGIYHGVMIFKPYEKNAEIGVWVNLNVGNAQRNINVQRNEGLLTGKIIAEDNNEYYSGTKDYSKIILYGLDSLFFILLVLFLLILKLKKKRDQEKQVF